MKTIILFIFLFSTISTFADDTTCEALTTDDFIGELMNISQEHEAMSVVEIKADYQSGIDFITNTFGKESKQYESMLVFVQDTSDMTVEDFGTVEGLRIQIIPILGPDSIYKEHQKTLMRKCRENLLAAMILT